MPHEARSEILGNLQRYGIDVYLNFEGEDTAELLTKQYLEREIPKKIPVEKLRTILQTTIYLAGGGVRDLIWHRNSKDYDFKVDASLEEMINRLESHGFTRTDSRHAVEGEFYVNERFKAIRIVIEGVDIDLSTMRTTDVESLIKEGDVNFNCCVYDVNNGIVVNPEIIPEIRDKILRFCDKSRALSDPTIVINALKQISRHPDIVIPEETMEIITQMIPEVLALIQKEPGLTYKLSSLFGNLNSHVIVQLFRRYDNTEDILNELDIKKDRLNASPRYVSVNINELSLTQKEQIARLMKLSYGKRFDESKLFSHGINSVIYEVKEEEIVACCLIDGERLYAAAARDANLWTELIADIVQHNYSVWCTVDYKNPKIQALCTIAGLKIEKDPTVISSILQAKSDKYKSIDIFTHGGYVLFKKEVPDDYPQVLFRS